MNFEEYIQAENIHRGINIKAVNRETFRNHIVKFLTSSPDAPLDVLEKTEIKKIDVIYVPVCFFEYHKTNVGFSYDVEYYEIPDDDDGRVKRFCKKETGSLGFTAYGVYPKNEQYPFVKEWYSCYKAEKTDSVETFVVPKAAIFSECDFSNIDLLAYISQTAKNEAMKKADALSKRKIMEKSNVSVKRQLSEGTVKNLTVDDVSCKSTSYHSENGLIGIYRVIFCYQGKEYFLYISGDGYSTYCAKRPPIDLSRNKTLSELTDEQKEISDCYMKMWLFSNLPLVFAALILFFRWGIMENGTISIICILGVSFLFLYVTSMTTFLPTCICCVVLAILLFITGKTPLSWLSIALLGLTVLGFLKANSLKKLEQINQEKIKEYTEEAKSIWQNFDELKGEEIFQSMEDFFELKR